MDGWMEALGPENVSPRILMAAEVVGSTVWRLGGGGAEWLLGYTVGKSCVKENAGQEGLRAAGSQVCNETF